MRRCSRCGQKKSLEEFPRNRSTSSGRGYHCKPCHNRVSRANREKNHGSVQSYMLQRRYGLNSAEIETLRSAQGDLCAVCRRAPANHVDHDHGTGLVRGILCFSCNGALGQFKDDSSVLERAIQYLAQPRLLCASIGTHAAGYVRRCFACRENKSRGLFVRPTSGKEGSPFCRQCYDRRDFVPEIGALIRRHYRLSRRYGIGLEQYARLEELQAGRCAICSHNRIEAVDHDHNLGIVRGLLCGSCNTGMGQLRDDPAIIRRAIDYLNRHRPHDVHEPAAPYILSVA